MNVEHVESLLPRFLSGGLDESVAAQVEDHLGTCSLCAEFRDELIGRGSSPEELQRALRHRVGKFSVYSGDIAELFAVSQERAREFLVDLEAGKGWISAGTGAEMMWAPRVGQSLCVVLRGVPGVTFPTHRHAGEERTFVLQGGFREDDGNELWRGMRLLKPPGSEHSVTVLDGPPCVAALRMDGRVAF